MKREIYLKMPAAAEEVLRLARDGVKVDALALEWAQLVAKSKPTPPPMRPALRQEAILAAMTYPPPPPEGLLAPTIFERCGFSKHRAAVTLCYMVAINRVHMLKIPGRSRYFLSEAALEIGRAHVAELERLRKQAREKPRKVPQLKAPPARVHPKASHKKRDPRPPPKAKRGKGDKAPAPREPVPQPGRLDPAAPAIYPPGLKVQKLPSRKDTRYTVEPPVEGAGFVREWKRKRGEE